MSIADYINVAFEYTYVAEIGTNLMDWRGDESGIALCWTLHDIEDTSSNVVIEGPRYRFSI